jgi:hypothetical protein
MGLYTKTDWRTDSRFHPLGPLDYESLGIRNQEWLGLLGALKKERFIARQRLPSEDVNTEAEEFPRLAAVTSDT